MMELLQAGNPELTEDDIRFGIVRAMRVFESHRRSHSQYLVLEETQLAAILADVHREAKGKPMKLNPGDDQ